MADGTELCVYRGEALARYGFGGGHPFGRDRHDAFWQRMATAGLDQRVVVGEPVSAERATIELFHTPEYVDRVARASAVGGGFLDAGDTPAFAGVYEVAATVVGTAVAAAEGLMAGHWRRAMVPIAGLHHARRDGAAGFCVFNDCGVVLEVLRQRYGLTRIAYVDIDAHHGDGVFYGFEDCAQIYIADIHEDGRSLYPGTGGRSEVGQGEARGTKLNIPLPAMADDQAFDTAWAEAAAFIEAASPQCVVLQCGADSLAGDPLTHLQYSSAAHYRAAWALSALADRHAQGRLLALGGGGYNRQNLAAAWTAVVHALLGDAEETSV